jgi:hypothetical protein
MRASIVGKGGFYPCERGSASGDGDRKDRVSFSEGWRENGANRGAFHGLRRHQPTRRTLRTAVRDGRRSPGGSWRAPRTGRRGAGLPCRISLDDAKPGETLILVNYEHQSAPTPFRASHAIFVREGVEPVAAVDEMPPALRRRLLALRAFDADGMMRAADIVEGAQARGLIEKLFENPEIAYLHAHYAKWGCYAARIDRA